MLCEIADISTGNSNTNEAVEDGKYPFFVRSQEPLRKNDFEYPDNARRTRTDAEERKVMEDFIDQKEGDTALGCLMTIYRIRCNMMHGLKIVEQLDDQYELFKAVNGVLESIR